jgi:ABC-type oligopeptide transport system ATPase subunit
LTFPKYLILDESVSALDVSIRARILDLLRRLQDWLELADVMIADDLAAGRYLSTHLAVRYVGNGVEAGAGDTVYAIPQRPYTQALLSAALPKSHATVRHRRARLERSRQRLVSRPLLVLAGGTVDDGQTSQRPPPLSTAMTSGS